MSMGAPSGLAKIEKSFEMWRMSFQKFSLCCDYLRSLIRLSYKFRKEGEAGGAKDSDSPKLRKAKKEKKAKKAKKGKKEKRKKEKRGPSEESGSGSEQSHGQKRSLEDELRQKALLSVKKE